MIVVNEPKKVQYRLRRSSRRRTIAIHVSAAGEVVVSAPQWVPVSEVRRIVGQKETWIRKQLDRMNRKAYPVITRQYQEGETWYLFGEPLVLRCIDDGKPGAAVDFVHRQIICSGRTGSNRMILLCRSVYREAGQSYIERRLVGLCRMLDNASGGSLRPHEVRLRSMKRRWGGCSRDGIVTLSLRLFCLPEHLVDYVVVHELVHLYVFHHGREFYQLLGNVIPQWREYRELLKRWSYLAVV